MSAGRPIDTLGYLLRIRQDMQRGRLLMYLGEKRVERLACFIDGYRAGLRANDCQDDAYERFTGWLQDSQKQAGGRGWPEEFLRNCHGNHELAIQKYLDLAAGFAAKSDDSPTVQEGHLDAAERKASGVGTLKVLLRIRQGMEWRDLLTPVTEASAECFETFVEGCHAYMLANGGADEEYGRFFEWLRDVRQELPGEGWPAKYLRDCHGDQEQAIRKYLDLAAEFAALEGKGK